MIAEVDEHRDEVVALCRQFGVRRLEVFGSATSGEFDLASSDIDFLVEIEPPEGTSRFDAFFGLKEALEALVGRPVDPRRPVGSGESLLRGNGRAHQARAVCRVILGPTSGTLDVPLRSSSSSSPIGRGRTIRLTHCFDRPSSASSRSSVRRSVSLAAPPRSSPHECRISLAIDDRLVWEVATRGAAPLVSVLDDMLEVES